MLGGGDIFAGEIDGFDVKGGDFGGGMEYLDGLKSAEDEDGGISSKSHVCEVKLGGGRVSRAH